MRKTFDEELAELNREMIAMGTMCEEGIAAVERSLEKESREEIQTIPEIRKGILEKEHQIENRCIRLLLLQQPMASDLREISSALKMVTDMYRIGEVAFDASEIIRYMKRFHHNLGIVDLCKQAARMVHDSVDSFVQRDEEKANEVVAYDDVVDDCFLKVKEELIQKVIDNTKEAEEYIDLLMIAKYFEKIGDHAVSISEWVLYSLSGVHQGEMK